MKNSSGFSYTVSAFVFIAVVSLLAGYLLGVKRSVKPTEGFANSMCNVCNQPKPDCGCKAACPSKCHTCNKCAGTCNCPPTGLLMIDDHVGPTKMNKVRKDYAGRSKMNKARNDYGDVPSVSPPTGLPDKCPPSAPCPVPDSTKYVLKSTVPPCPPMPDLTRYMLKTECPSQPDMSKYVLKSSVPKCPPCISTCSKPCKIGECPPCPRPRCPIVQCPDPKPCPACPDVQVAACPEPRVQCKAQYEPESKVRPMMASTAAFGL